MKANLVGVRDFGNLKMNDGTVLDGAKMFFNYYTPDVKGFAADGKYLSLEAMTAFGISTDLLKQNVGSDINIEYGPKNTIVGVSVMNVMSVPSFEQSAFVEPEKTEKAKK